MVESVLIPLLTIGISTLFVLWSGGLSGQCAGFSGWVDQCPFWKVEWIEVMREAESIDIMRDIASLIIDKYDAEGWVNESSITNFDLFLYS